MNLSECKANDNVFVNRIGGSGVFRKRLLEMGIMRGEALHVQKYAPLNDPLEIVLKNYHLTLRVEEAEKIMVNKITSKAA
jgi:Fe2+ transport system protein FeoA